MRCKGVLLNQCDVRTMILRWLSRKIPAASALLALRSEGKPLPGVRMNAAGFGIAVQCWTFRKFTLFEAIEMAAIAGAGGVEMFPGQEIGGGHGTAKLGPGMDRTLFDAVAARLDEFGLTAYNFGVADIPADEARARETFEFAKRFGMYGITTESIGSIDTLEKLSMEYGIKICFHNHPKPTKLWNPETVAEAIAGRHENLGFCADIGHWATCGLDTLETARKHAPRIHSLHLKDRSTLGEWSHDRPYGTGVIDLAGILDEVRGHGFAGNVTIEYEHNWKANLYEVAQCVGFLKGYAQSST
jgi:sugar phosphate isomerase/epimerase